MNKLRIAPLLGLCACAVHAAETPDTSTATSGIVVLRGQLTFLNSSTAFCAEQMPSMKKALDNARDHAEEEIGKAEATIVDGTAEQAAKYKPYFDMYASTWSKYAAELMAALKRQSPRAACPDLLSNWQAADADQILEDWRGFAERNGLGEAQ